MPLPDRARRGRGFLPLVLLALAGVLIPAGVLAAKPPSPVPVTIQILNVSDWHGNLDPISVTGVGSVGGAGVISAYWQADRIANPNTLTLTAGDDFGATPPLSGFFEERPSVLAQRLMGIQVGTFGNHNFDRGLEHLQSMIDLAGSSDPSVVGSPFSYVSSDLVDPKGELSGVDAFKIFEVGGIKVAVVGVTNPEAPGLVLPGNFGSITINNAVASANKAKAAAHRAGAKVVVAITHMGVRGFVDGQPFGELIDFANAVGGFDVIFGDHTDVVYSGVINNQLVHENRSFGVTYAKTSLTVNPVSGQVTDRSVTFVTPLASAVTPDPAVESMLAPFRAALSAILDEPIGTATDTFIRRYASDLPGNSERMRETPLGDLVADGMRWRYGTQIGYMNGGGIRTNLPNSAYLPADLTLRRPSPGYAAGPPWDLVLGDIYSVLPFNNIITTRTVTGAQLYAMLENGVSQVNSATGLGTDGRFPQVSGLRLTFNYTCAAGSRVKAVALDDGTPILPDATTYTVALPNFVNLGGDSYSMLADGQGVTRDLDAAVMHEYMTEFGPNFNPADYPLDRITKLGTSC
jgi:5'-nucleotidase